MPHLTKQLLPLWESRKHRESQSNKRTRYEDREGVTHILKKQFCELLLTPMCANSFESMSACVPLCVWLCVWVGVYVCVFSTVAAPPLSLHWHCKRTGHVIGKYAYARGLTTLPATHIIESMPCVMWHGGLLQQLFPKHHCSEWALWIRRMYKGSNPLLCLNIRH